MADDTVQVELERLRAENEALKLRAIEGVTPKVSEKGGVSVYRLGRFPVTFYKEQWEKLLGMADDISTFIAEHETELKTKASDRSAATTRGKYESMPKYRRGSGSIYKKRSVYYVAYYANGKQVCESTGTKDKAEARRILQARLGQLAEGRYVGPAAERVTFEELAEGLYTNYRVNGRKTLRDAAWRVKLHLVPFFGHKKAQEITSADVQAFIAQRKEHEASNGEIGRELAALKRMFNLALHTEKIIRAPYIPTLAEDNVRQGFFERGEFEATLARLPAWLRLPATFCYQVGWRMRAEVLLLTWR
jgi:hypothetical protein